MLLYIVGGKQREARTVTDHDPNWYSYSSGLVLKVDTVSEQVTVCYEHTSKEGTCLPNDPVLFKSGSRNGDEIYLCSQTEVMVFDLPSFDLKTHISLPFFNDVHHVIAGEDDSLIVANTGLEMVVNLSRDGDILNAWNVLAEDAWA